MPIINGYATVEALNKRLGRNDQSMDGFDILEDCINSASRFIDHMTGRFFYTKTLSSEPVDVYGDSENGLYISPSRRFIYAYAPVISVSSIVENGESLTENTDFWIYNQDQKIMKNGSWTTEKKGIVVSGSIGYALTPAEINQICLSVAEVFTGLGIRSYVGEDGSQVEVIQRNIPKWIFDRLKMYEIIRVI